MSIAKLREHHPIYLKEAREEILELMLDHIIDTERMNFFLFSLSSNSHNSKIMG